MGEGHAPVGDAAPQNRVHLRHVGTPEHKGVGGFKIVVAAHGFIHAKSAHKTGHGGRHTVACIWVKIVGAQAGFHQFARGIGFPNSPLAGAKHGHTFGAVIAQRGFGFVRHNRKGLCPGDGRELAIFIVLAVRHAQHGLLQTVAAVHDFGEEITLRTIQAAVHFGFHIAVGGNHAVVFGGHHHPAASAAKTAGRFVPFKVGEFAVGN